MLSIYCVTGANSFLGSHLVNKLLAEGNIVHATVRDLSNAQKYNFLYDLPNAKTNLKLFEADLLKEGSFNAALAGCSGLFHVAGPWLSQGTWAEHWEPIVNGTRNVISSAINHPSIHRIVLVSSCAAVYCVCSGLFNKEKCHYTESDWNSLQATDHDQACQASKSAEKSYFQAKTAGERQAWELVKEANLKDPNRKLSLVSINPSVVFGPPLSSPSGIETLNTSLQILPGLFFGGDSGGTGTVDVKDVTEALYKAMINPNANGRYILNGGSYHFSKIASLLAKLYPDRCFGEEVPNDESLIPYFNTDRAKLELGIQFTPFEVTLKSTMDALISKNCLPSF
jgi:nucleoside-diphosphate-sugar epimerase